MTFYWWSHWFWITILGFACVNSYPSQETSGELKKERSTKINNEVTKLYQTTAEFSWSTSVSPYIVEKTILKSISSDKDLDELLDNENIDVDEALDDESLDDNFNTELENIDKEEERTEGSIKEAGEDYKRSAEIFSKTKENLDLEYDLTKGSIKVLKEEIITFSTPVNRSKEDIQTPVESNISRTIDSETVKDNKFNNQNSKFGETVDDKVKSSAATPSTPKIINSNHSIHIENVTTQAPYILSNSTESAEDIHKAPFTLENVNREDDIRRAENEHRTRKPKVLSADYKNMNRVINYSSQTKSLLTRSASTEANQYSNNNIASEALSVQRTYFLDASAISAICFTIFGVCCTIGTIGVVLYRRRYLNKPQTLSEPDSSVYIDDSTLRVSDNSDEMYSLDNDSFLNSLEAMTIQNYWTDTVKHTKL